MKLYFQNRYRGFYNRCSGSNCPGKRRKGVQIFFGIIVIAMSTTLANSSICEGMVYAAGYERSKWETYLLAETGAEAQEALPVTVSDADQNKDLNLYAQAAALLDGETGRILYGKNAEALMPNASTTKILTCIIAIEQGNLDQICTASEYACSMPETKCGFAPGESFYLKDLLYSLMLESQNDSAVVIAETIGGNVEQFAALMNEKAAEIGCQTYHFVTPNGLDGEDAQGSHGVSAADLAKIMNYCRKNKKFLEITQAADHSFSNTEGTRQYQVQNKNAFLTMQNGIVSGKTGYTSKAGYCYVCSYEENGRSYSIALLACGWPNHKNYKWEDAKKLIAYGNEHFEREDIRQQNVEQQAEVTGGIRFTEDGWEFPQSVSLRPGKETIERLLALDETVTTQVRLDRKITLPTNTDTAVGSLELYVGKDLVGSQKLYVKDEVEPFEYSLCVKLVLKEFLQNLFT